VSKNGVRLSLVHPLIHTKLALQVKICLFYLPLVGPRKLSEKERCQVVLSNTHDRAYL
jgi:hypothetical protein